MTATNHALTGALLGAVLPLPIAIPVAFISHFVLDSLPHYGIPLEQRSKSKIYRLIVYGDTALALAIAVLAAIFRKWNMEIVGWVAYSPDASWVFHYFKQNRNLHIKTNNRFMELHRNIQLFERPWGIYTEILFALILFVFFIHFITK